MKKLELAFAIILAFTILPYSTYAQLSVEFSFYPPELSGLCGVAHHHDNGELWLYQCNDNEITKYDLEGNFIQFIPMVGGAANDVDLEIAPEDLMLGDSFVEEGSLLVINGESGVAEIYALDHNTGEVIDTLVTEFGASHVVGGAYHPDRDTFYLIQDNVPAGASANLVVEIDPVSGAILDSLPLSGFFNVNYGDLDISSFSGNIFLVSSVEFSIGEYTPQGWFVQDIPFPAELPGQTGISLDCNNGEAWTVSSAASRISGFICDNLVNGIDENGQANGLFFFPNPSNGKLTVRSPRVDEVGILTIHDFMGRTVLSESTPSNASSIQIDLGSFPPAFYSIKWSYDDAEFVGRLAIE